MRYVAEFKESMALDDVPTVFSEANGIPHPRIKGLRRGISSSPTLTNYSYRSFGSD